MEAVPERIDFTRERLRQERILNVHLVQASATALPLAENSFDLVVVNGVLEWVGEWDLTVDPRTVQINFLKKICRLLKRRWRLADRHRKPIRVGLFPGGLTITREFRTRAWFPAAVASFMLRHSSKPHYRTQLNARKQYRTYTYSEGGYRRLLSDAGFAEMSSYWADPGYNQPYYLVPLAIPDWVQQHSVELLDHPSPAPRRSWVRRLKRVATPFSQRLVPDFVLLAAKQPGRSTKLQRWVEECLVESDKTPSDPAVASDQSRGHSVHTRSTKLPSFGSGMREQDPTLAYLKVFTGAARMRSPL